jgi:hypothetical protein
MKIFPSIRSTFTAFMTALRLRAMYALTPFAKFVPRVITGQPIFEEKPPIYIAEPSYPVCGRRGCRAWLMQARREYAAKLLKLAAIGKAPKMNRAARRLEAKQRLRFI